MSVIYSIIKKDFSKYWLLCLTWTLFLVIAPYFEAVHFKGVYETYIMATGSNGILYIFRILRYCIPFFIITPLIVHEDVLIKSDAFWLTRPISRIQLFLSKAITLFILTALLPSLSELGTLLLKDLPHNEIAPTWIDIILYQLSVHMPAFLISSITINFYQYIMYLVLLAGTSAVAYVILFSIRTLATFSTLDFKNPNFTSIELANLFEIHLSPVILNSLLTPFLFVTVIYTQYVYRRRFLSLLLLLVIFSSYGGAILLQDSGQSRKISVDTTKKSSTNSEKPHLEAKIIKVAVPTNVTSSDPDLKSLSIDLELESNSPIIALTMQKPVIKFTLDDGSSIGIKEGYLKTTPGLTLSGEGGIKVREVCLEKMLSTEFGTTIHILNKRNSEISFSLTSTNGEVEKILSHKHTTNIQFQLQALQLKKSFLVRANEAKTTKSYPFFLSSIPYNSPSMQVLSQYYLFALATKNFTRSRLDRKSYRSGLFSIDEDTIDILVNSKTGEALMLNKVKGSGDGLHSPFIEENVEQFSSIAWDDHPFQISKAWISDAEFIRYNVFADTATYTYSAYKEEDYLQPNS